MCRPSRNGSKTIFMAAQQQLSAQSACRVCAEIKISTNWRRRRFTLRPGPCQKRSETWVASARCAIGAREKNGSVAQPRPEPDQKKKQKGCFHDVRTCFCFTFTCNDKNWYGDGAAVVPWTEGWSVTEQNGLSWSKFGAQRAWRGHRHRGSGLFLFAATIQPSPDEDDG